MIHVHPLLRRDDPPPPNRNGLGPTEKGESVIRKLESAADTYFQSRPKLSSTCEQGEISAMNMQNTIYSYHLVFTILLRFDVEG